MASDKCEDGAPTFSLGLTQEQVTVGNEGYIVAEPLAVAVSPINFATPDNLDEHIRGKKREVAVSNALKSPYLSRVVDEKKDITADERRLCNFIFASNDIDTFLGREEVFATVKEYKMLRDTLATMRPGEWVIKGMFEQTSVTKEVLEHLKTNMMVVVNGNEKELELRNYDMNRNIDPIDNRVYEEDSLENYSHYPKSMKIFFVDYMKMVGHPIAYEMAGQVIQILEMSWRTVKNHTDCGIFVMRHSETYMGDEGRGWHCGWMRVRRYKEVF